MQIERSEIKMFSAVVEAGGFSRAAEVLSISQSAVSQAVANLEHKLNTRLLVRGRSPQLTEAGKRLFSYARTVINEERHALEDIEQIRSGALSTLSLAMNSMVNRVYGLDLMLDFCEHNPLTRLELEVAPSRAIIYGVEEDRWELGFGPFQQRMPGHFEVHPYFFEQRMLVVHKTHPDFQRLTTQPSKALKDATLLTSYLDDAPRRSEGERMRDHFAAVWEVSNLSLRLALAEAGKGVTYLSDRLLGMSPGFVPIAAHDLSVIERQVGLYHRRHTVLSEGAKRFVAICDRYFSAANLLGEA